VVAGADATKNKNRAQRQGADSFGPLCLRRDNFEREGFPCLQ
jgi:hypothetical protein